MYKLDEERHENVYLDSPADDSMYIDDRRPSIGKPPTVYILPIAKDTTYAASHARRDLLCLILGTTEKKGTLKRVGMTNLSPFVNTEAMAPDRSGDVEYKILKSYPSDIKRPHHGGYDAATGMYRISLT